MQRNTYTTIALALSSVRADCWSTAQLVLLDRLITVLCDDLSDLNPRFDRERFATLARKGHNHP